MAEGLTLVGFKHSVYTWIVRLALRELRLEADYVETNPFEEPPDETLARYTPFRRVPVFLHGKLRLTETAAILRYLDATWGQHRFEPSDPAGLAQMAQVAGLVDADVYPLLVRKVFSQGYYLPRVAGLQGDPALIAEGLDASHSVLKVLDQIASEGRVLNGNVVTLADLHLAPMMSYAMRVPEVAPLLEAYPAVAHWWDKTKDWDSLVQTDPLRKF